MSDDECVGGLTGLPESVQCEGRVFRSRRVTEVLFKIGREVPTEGRPS